MFLSRVFLALSALALVLCGQVVRADVTTGTASAYGVNANVGLSATGTLTGSATLSVGPTPTVSGSAPPPFNNSNSAVSTEVIPSIGILGVGHLRTDILNVNAQSNVTGTGAGMTSASANVANLSSGLVLGSFGFALPGEFVNFGATAVQSTAQVTGDIGALVPSGTTTIVGGMFSIGSLATIGLVDLSDIVFASANPAPNTTITINDALLVSRGGVAGTLSGSITVVLNKQIVTGDGNTTSGMTVNAIDITFNQFAGFSLPISITQSGNLIVSQSQAGQTAAAPGGGPGGGAQPVPEPSSLALCAILGVAGMVSRRKRRRPLQQAETV